MQPRAIETRYSGCRFRSRLEARWAVYLNAIRAKWVYEPEGFVLADGAHYLPDFFVSYYDSDENEAHRDWGYWLEIKRFAPTAEEQNKFSALCRETGHHGAICYGSFPKVQLDYYGYNRDGIRTEEIWHLGQIPALTNRHPKWSREAHNLALLCAAEARFEHGEKGAR